MTQWEVVATCERLSEAYLLPVLEVLRDNFPFMICGFHTDNGSEYIHHRVAPRLPSDCAIAGKRLPCPVMTDGGPYRSRGTDRRQSWAMALLWLCVAVGLTEWAVQRSAEVGRLAAPPRYDDINYFNAALRWLHRWNELGPLDALTAFLQDPPRAPFPELLAAGSFAIGGVDLAAPYLASFFIPWVALLWTRPFARGAPAVERLLIGLYVCTMPLLTVGVTQFRPDRPDPFWGIVLGGAMRLLLTERMVGATVRHLLAVGALFGAACLIKTSTFPVTAAALRERVVIEYSYPVGIA